MSERDPSGDRRYRFGPFRLNAGERRLYREGELVPLPRKVFNLLLILVENAGRLQTREELIEALWPKNIVEEQGLSTKVYLLRRKLGDEEEPPQYIETVRGVGYRFIAPVTNESEEAAAPLPQAAAAAADSPPGRENTATPLLQAAPAGADSPPGAGGPKRRRALRSGAGIAVLVALFIVTGLLVWRLTRRPPVVTATRTATPSIAVLPFENLSADPANAYFVVGIQDEILTRLANIRALKVISRTSTERYASRPDDLPTIARQLGVTAVLEGSVQKEGDVVHINVQLIDTRTQVHLWAQSYDRTLTDVFGMEGEVAEKIAESLSAELLPPERAQLTRVPTRNPQAYDLFLKANYYSDQVFARGDAKDPAAATRLATAFYRQATVLDPRFALAWAQLSLLESRAWWYGIDASTPRIAAAAQAAKQALALDPDLPQAQMAMGYAEYYGREDYSAALAQFERAQENLPNDPDVIVAIAYIHRRQGKWQQALAEFQQAAELDPRNPLRHYEIGVSLTELRRYGEAGQQFDQALAIEPYDYVATAYKIRLLFLAGATVQARRVLATVPRDIDPQGSFSALRFESGWLARRPDRALAALASTPAWVLNAATEYEVPASLLQAKAWALKGDGERAREAYEDARTKLQAALQQQPDDPTLWGALGMAAAGLGEKKAAVQAGLRATQLLPVSRDAFYGTAHLAVLAGIYAQTGKPDQAVRLLRRLLAMPAGGAVSVPLLRLDPTWDPIRHDPRFQALLKQYAKRPPVLTTTASIATGE